MTTSWKAWHHILVFSSSAKDEDEPRGLLSFLGFFLRCRRWQWTSWFVIISWFFSSNVEDDDELGGSQLVIIAWFYFSSAEDDNELGGSSSSLDFFSLGVKDNDEPRFGFIVIFCCFALVEEDNNIVACCHCLHFFSCKRWWKTTRLIIVSWFFSYSAENDDEARNSSSSSSF